MYLQIERLIRMKHWDKLSDVSYDCHRNLCHVYVATALFAAKSFLLFDNRVFDRYFVSLSSSKYGLAQPRN